MDTMDQSAIERIKELEEDNLELVTLLDLANEYYYEAIAENRVLKEQLRNLKNGLLDGSYCVKNHSLMPL